MMQAVTVGLDIAKNVFHAYGVGAEAATNLWTALRSGILSLRTFWRECALS